MAEPTSLVLGVLGTRACDRIFSRVNSANDVDTERSAAQILECRAKSECRVNGVLNSHKLQRHA